MSDNNRTPATDVALRQPSIERVERFQALQAGQYWKAKNQIPSKAINADEVLLLQSIRWVDNSPHTIIVRAHPSKFGSSVRFESVNAEGKPQVHHVTCGEHAFLLSDFLANFEFEPDSKQIRAGEIKRLQGEVMKLQNELIQAQSDPAILQKIVDEAMKTQPAQSGGVGAPDTQITETSTGVHLLAGIANGTLSGAIETGITKETIAALSIAANHELKVATIQGDWIQSKTRDIAATVQAMAPYFSENAAAALAATEDVRNHVEALLEGIQSLDLYVGEGVEVQAIRTGISADSSIPLSIVQRKLKIDEELAVYTDLDEWFDFNDFDLFKKALVEHEGLVNQIFPTKRCILVLATTHRYIDYGSDGANIAGSQENRKVFLMARDGENIHRIISPVESHLGSARLFPSKDDQDRVFRGVDGSQITFKDVAYTKHLKAHAAFALHYKRFLLLICGLDHRLNLFGKFYQGAQSLQFMTQAFQDKWLRFIHDDDGAGMLPKKKRQPVRSWIAEKNSYLKSGSRVLCNWTSLMNPDTAPGACKIEDRTYTGFSFRFQPTEDVGMRVVARGGEDLHVFVDVKGWGRINMREFSTKVTLTALQEGRWNRVQTPYLVLDAVSPAELQWYIHDRDSREGQVEYIRFFKTALRHIQAERAQEAGTRAHLLSALTIGRLASGDQAEAIVDKAVTAWRAANRGKDLPQFEDGSPPAAWRSLLDQMFLLAGSGEQSVGVIKAHYEQQEYETLRITVTGASKFHVYLAPTQHEMDNRLEPHAWVHRVVVMQGKTKLIEKERRWVALRTHDASETRLFEADDAVGWIRESAFQSHAHKQSLLNQCDQYAATLDSLTGVECISPNDHWDLVEQWLGVREDISQSRVGHPVLAIPLGVLCRRGMQMATICATTDNAFAHLHRIAPNDFARSEMKALFIELYHDKHAGLRGYENAIAAADDWSLAFRYGATKGTEPPFSGRLDFDNALIPNVTVNPLFTYRLRDWIGRLSQSAKVWVSERAIADGGDQINNIDQCLKLELPIGFAPVNMAETIAHNDDQTPIPYGHWFDIAAVDIPMTQSRERPVPASRYSHTNKQFINIDAALEYVQAKAKGRPVVPAVEVSGPLEPAPGIQRWFAVTSL
ncbi:hypothetical protein [Pseudomonas sp. LS-2]|uniref:hypothetical protein n=1 Tax=Pseudomonas sp. LS-2 TaxID=2315859 RepID=UPI000E75D839|nr:hypothetical protein [Pseudomonas sp. LS-2]RJX82284.1 hypothetical protein D3M70_06850 [Pseudomonas sp. LS-2]